MGWSASRAGNRNRMRPTRAGDPTPLCFPAAICSESTRLHKTTALMLQGYLGAFGSGAWYTGHEGLGVASMGALGLIAIGLVLRACVFKPSPTTGRAAMEARRLTSPADVAKGESRSGAIVGALVYGGVSLALLLWLVGQVGIMADWIVPANGCGWALRAASKAF